MLYISTTKCISVDKTFWYFYLLLFPQQKPVSIRRPVFSSHLHKKETHS